jgi:hypothetical protein
MSDKKRRAANRLSGDRTSPKDATKIVGASVPTLYWALHGRASRNQPRLPFHGQLTTRKGFMMRRPSSSAMPCCMSSDHNVSQPA